MYVVLILPSWFKMRSITAALILSTITLAFAPCPVSCGINIFGKHEGHLSSPRYPRPSPPFLSCNYNISVESRFNLFLNFTDTFQIESVNTPQGPRCQHHWLQVLAKVFLTLNDNKKSTTLIYLSVHNLHLH